MVGNNVVAIRPSADGCGIFNAVSTNSAASISSVAKKLHNTRDAEREYSPVSVLNRYQGIFSQGVTSSVAMITAYTSSDTSVLATMPTIHQRHDIGIRVTINMVVSVRYIWTARSLDAN